MSILELPNETLTQILLSLPVSSIINCAKCCKNIQQLVYQDHIWRILCETIHGVDTVKNRQYNGHWRRVFSEGRAPWINLENKRYIQKVVHKAKWRGECIEYSASNEDLVLNLTRHGSGSYSPSMTLAVEIMDTNNFQVKKIEGFPDKHFKKVGNYLLLFRMDSDSYIYPHGITTNSFTVFKFDPIKYPTSVDEALYKVDNKHARRGTFMQAPKMIFNSMDPELIYYAACLKIHSSHSELVPLQVDIFDLRTESAKPIKSQKLLGNTLAFSGNYVALSNSFDNSNKQIYLIDWHDFTDEFGDDCFDIEGKAKKILGHNTPVNNVLIHGDLVVCYEKVGHVTIWSLQEDVPKVLKRIDLTSYYSHSVRHFDGTFLWVAFSPKAADPNHACIIMDWRTEKRIEMALSPKVMFTILPLTTKGGNYSGKMIMSANGRTDILYTSTPYLAKKFDVAVLTSNGDKITAKRVTTIFGHLAEDCKTLIGLSKSSSLTSQVLFEKGSVRYVLLFEEDVVTRQEKADKTPLTELLHMTLLPHHNHSPYGGLDVNERTKDYSKTNMRGISVISVNDLRINGACLLMKEEQSEEFGWVPVNLEHNLEMLLGDIVRDMEDANVMTAPLQ